MFWIQQYSFLIKQSEIENKKDDNVIHELVKRVNIWNERIAMWEEKIKEHTKRISTLILKRLSSLCNRFTMEFILCFKH